jgi:hypothetical protein
MFHNKWQQSIKAIHFIIGYSFCMLVVRDKTLPEIVFEDSAIEHQIEML